MRITKLSLTNFRSFKETQTIEFAPVTLLFGPNSVGKSSVLMALFYVQNILAKGDCNPLRLEALGDKYVGGVENLVYGKDTSNTMRIKIDYDKCNQIGSSYTATRELLGRSDELEIDWLINLPEASTSVEKVSVEFVVNMSKLHKQAYVSECNIWLDDIELTKLTSRPDGKQVVIDSLNYHHPVLLGDEHEEWLENRYSEDNEDQSRKVPRGSFFHELINHDAHSKNVPASSSLNHLINLDELFNIKKLDYKTHINSSIFMHAPIAFVSTPAGAIPELLQPLTIAPITGLDNKKSALVSEILSDAIVPVFDNLLNLLNSSLCIGPIRKIPDAIYQSGRKPRQKDWYDGSACWSTLDKRDYHQIREINGWMNGKDKFNLGYEFVYTVSEGKAYCLTPADGLSDITLHMANIEAQKVSHDVWMSEYETNMAPIDEKRTEKEIEELIEEHDSKVDAENYLSVNSINNTALTLWDINNKIEVSASDIGVGVSQLLPLIVAAVDREEGLIACEQPELHVHPRVQVAIGDLLTQQKSDVGFLIETHSEHLILRILRRIRETTEGKLPEGFKNITPDDASITYLESTAEGVKTRRIHIDEDGDFQESWPDGFFDERDAELF